MSVTTVALAQEPSTATTHRSVLIPGLLATVAASAATTAIAAIAHGAGVSFADRSGSAIPVSGFASLTVLFSLIGVGLAAVLARRSARPRTMFLRITVTLLVLSFVPDLVSGFAANAAAILILAHIAAAAIVVPTLSARLTTQR